MSTFEAVPGSSPSKIDEETQSLASAAASTTSSSRGRSRLRALELGGSSSYQDENNDDSFGSSDDNSDSDDEEYELTDHTPSMQQHLSGRTTMCGSYVIL